MPETYKTKAESGGEGLRQALKPPKTSAHHHEPFSTTACTVRVPFSGVQKGYLRCTLAVCLGAATRNWLLQGLPEVDPPHQNVKIQFTSVLSTETQSHQAILVGSLMVCCLKCEAALQAAASGLVRAVQAVAFNPACGRLWATQTALFTRHTGKHPARIPFP